MTVTFGKLGNYGRTGNCLFQIAATIGYAKKHNIDFHFPKWNESKYFKLDESFYKDQIHFDNTYEEKRFRYDDIPNVKNVNLHGYFQSWKYFSHCEDYIRENLSLVEEEDIDLFRGVCGIHVRRGDYLKFPNHHPVQTMEYYNQAMDEVGASRYVIFSDDIEWCQKNFTRSNCIVSEKASPHTDLSCMTACNHFIIANSSFSWWAAWLSKHEDKKVIAPKNWFGPAISKTNPIDDLIPETWTLI
jgi:hypothetical protein